MSVDEMILALDRISRFKFPEKKLKRVYIETICSHLISPSLKKTDIEKFDNKSLTQYFTDIWNYSVENNFGKLNTDYTLNKNYVEQEKACYITNKELLDLMPKNADFKTLINNIPSNKIPSNFKDYKTPQKIVLTEGITEEILLPEFSKIHGYSWEENRVKIVGTGGKSKILTFYNIFKSQIKIPIYILLDNDAQIIFEQIKMCLRNTDCVHIISVGEIEDIIPVSLFKKAVNTEYKLQAKISVKDFDKSLSMVDNLHNIYKNNGFGEFKKSKMAQLIKDILSPNIVLSEELTEIMNEIKAL